MKRDRNLKQVQVRKRRHQTPDHTAQINRINELTKTAKVSWFGLLSYLSFVGVTLMGVTDADFFLVERSTQLPLIGVSIPTFLFFAIAPTLGVTLFAYLHLHLIKLWEALRDDRIPASIDDTPISDHLTPWIITDFALSRRKGALRKLPMIWLVRMTGLLLIYLAPLTVLGFFWWRSMPAHNEILTLSAGAALFLTLYIAVTSISRLRRLQAARKQHRAARFVILVFAAITIACFSWWRTETPLNGPFGKYAVFDLAPAQLQGVNFVNAPDNFQQDKAAMRSYRIIWCKENNLLPNTCGPVPPQKPAAFLENQRLVYCSKMFATDTENLADKCNTHFTAMDRKFTEDWKYHRQQEIAVLQNRDLSGVDLRKANLRDAKLQGAYLGGAELQEADLEDAKFDSSTNLTEALFHAASVRFVDFTNISISAEQINSMFGDGSVTQPKGMHRPAHWPVEKLGLDEFPIQWRRWQKSIGFTPGKNTP